MTSSELGSMGNVFGAVLGAGIALKLMDIMFDKKTGKYYNKKTGKEINPNDISESDKRKLKNIF